MLRALTLSTALLLAAFFGPIETVQAEPRKATLAELDEPLERAGSLREFLSSPTLRDEYFEKLRAYFVFDDSVFPRSSYDRFLSQVEAVVASEPSLANVLFKKNGAETFPITALASVDSLKLDRSIWRSYYQNWLQQLRARAGNDGLPADESRALEILRQAQAEFDAVLAESKLTGDKSKVGQWVKASEQSQELKAAAGTAMLALVKKNAEFFEHPASASALLYNVQAFHPEALMAGYPGLIKKFVTDLLPNVRDMYAQKVFTATNPGQPKLKQITAERVPRQFHTIWSGVCFNSCIGGKLKQIDALTPIGWASGTIEGAKNYYLTFDDKSPAGWFEMTPVKKKSSGEIFTVFTVGSETLADSFLTVKSGIAVDESPLIQQLLRDPNVPWPTGNKNLIMSESNSLNNAGGPSRLRATGSYRLGSDAGLATDYETLSAARDLKIATIAARFGNPSQAAYYGNQITLDINFLDSGKMTKLVPPASNSISNEELFNRLMVPGKDSSKALSSLLQLAKPESPLAARVIQAWKNSDQSARTRIIDFLKTDAGTGSLIATSVLKETVTPNSETFLALFTKKIEKNPQHHMSLLQNMDFYFELGGTTAELAPLISSFRTVDQRISVLKTALRYAGSEADVLDLLPKSIGDRDTSYKRRLTELRPLFEKKLAELKAPNSDFNSRIERLIAKPRPQAGMCSDIFLLK